MSNHSQEGLPQDFMDEMKRAMGLGPTGKFPEGKLTETDEGEIKIAIGNKNGKVIIDFGSPVTWIGFTPEQAEEIANILKKNADEAGKQRF